MKWHRVCMHVCHLVKRRTFYFNLLMIILIFQRWILWQFALVKCVFVVVFFFFALMSWLLSVLMQFSWHWQRHSQGILGEEWMFLVIYKIVKFNNLYYHSYFWHSLNNGMDKLYITKDLLAFSDNYFPFQNVIFFP